MHFGISLVLHTNLLTGLIFAATQTLSVRMEINKRNQEWCYMGLLSFIAGLFEPINIAINYQWCYGFYLSGHPNVNENNVGVCIVLYEDRVTVYKNTGLGLSKGQIIFELPYEKIDSTDSRSHAILEIIVLGHDKNNNSVRIPIVLRICDRKNINAPNPEKRDQIKAILDQEVIKNREITI